VFDWKKHGEYREIIDILKHDGVLLAASDTVLGLFAQLTEKGKQKLDIIKVRNAKPYIVMIRSQAMLSQFVDQQLDEQIIGVINRCWPGPLTIIFRAKKSLPDWMKGFDGTIAIRVPDHEGLQVLLECVGALFTTSANISDQPLPKKYDEVDQKILDQVQAVCCNPTMVYDGPASTIIDASSGSIKIIRQGVVGVDSN